MNTSANSELLEGKAMTIKNQNRFLDFAVFFMSQGYKSCTLPILVEIKPYTEGSLGGSGAVVEMEWARAQIEEQARFAFDEYKDLTKIHVIIIIDYHWDIKEFKRVKMHALPDNKVNPRKCGALPSAFYNPSECHYDITSHPLWKDDQEDFSDGFKKAWGDLMAGLSLTTDWT